MDKKRKTNLFIIILMNLTVYPMILVWTGSIILLAPVLMLIIKIFSLIVLIERLDQNTVWSGYMSSPLLVIVIGNIFAECFVALILNTSRNFSLLFFCRSE